MKLSELRMLTDHLPAYCDVYVQRADGAWQAIERLDVCRMSTGGGNSVPSEVCLSGAIYVRADVAHKGEAVGG